MTDTLVDAVEESLGSVAVAAVVKELPALSEAAEAFAGQVTDFLSKHGLPAVVDVVSRVLGGPAAVRAQLDATLQADYVANDLSANIAETEKVGP